MPMPARNSVMASFVFSMRPSSGTRTMAMRPPLDLRKLRFHHLSASDGFHQELEDLDVAGGRSQVFPPRVHSMATHEQTMNVGMRREEFLCLSRKDRHVLVVVEDWYPLAMLMRVDAFKPFQHFVAFNMKPAVRVVIVRQHRGPHRMRVHDCACTN